MPKVVKKNKTKKTEEDFVEQKEPDISVFNRDGLEFLEETESGVIDLVLTDPPYITSRKTGMDEHSKKVIELDASGKTTKTEKQWKDFKSKKEWDK